MSCRTLMAVPVLGQANAPLFGVTAKLAQKLDARVIGLAACRPVHTICQDYAVPASLFEQDRLQMQRQFHDIELQFRAAMMAHGSNGRWETRTFLEPLAMQVAEESILADLIVVSLAGNGGTIDATRQPDLCDLVVEAGRPVILVPSARPPVAFDRILVAWKDAREARRVVADSLPLLARATVVTIAAIEDAGDSAAASQGLERVRAWLASHDIVARTRGVPPRGANAVQLIEIALELNADLIVAGARGYLRQGRWMLGGVTSGLLAGDQCALVSH